MKQLYANLILFIILLLTITGCTYDLWAQKSREFTYVEAVSEILLSEDSQTLAVISPSFHYLFKVETPLKNALASHFKSQLTADFSNFHVTPDQEISGQLVLSLPATVTETELTDAERVGFSVISPKHYLQLVIILHGERYDAGKALLPKGIQKPLNQNYLVTIIAETGLSTLEKIKSTPIALLGDALVIGVIPLYPIGLLVKSLEE